MRRLLHTVKNIPTSLLPPWYTQVTWMSANENLKTNYHCNQDTEIECKWYKYTTNNKYVYAWDVSSSLTTNTTAYVTSGNWNWRFDGDAIGLHWNNRTAYVTIQNKEWVRRNGTKYGSYNNVSNYTWTATLGLWSSTTGVMRIYYLQVRDYNTKEILHNYIPCLNSDDKAWIFDTVDGEFFEIEDQSGAEYWTAI